MGVGYRVPAGDAVITQAETDADMQHAHESDGPEPGDECGRWDNAKLMRHCAKAGSEDCEWECPYRNRANV